MGKYDDLNKLEDLRQKGVISEEEFQCEKAKILASEASVSTTAGNNSMLGLNEENYLMVMHLSQFAGLIIPFAGLVAPILLWQINAKNNAEIDRHGKNIVNFMISMAIYAVVALLLCFAIIGIPILIALGVLEIVFVIIAAIKANKGEYWRYPMSITFFS